MRSYGNHLLQTFAEGPVLINPEKVGLLRTLAEQKPAGLISTVLSSFGLGARGPESSEQSFQMQIDACCAAMGVKITDRSKPFAFSDGLAIIPVWGVLLHRDNWCDSYATGYDYIRSKVEAAAADPDVKGIVYDVHSPGGHVAGCFELADDMFALRDRKPSLALVDSMCYSAAYSLGSTATKISATPSSGVGSIGVVMMHVSVEKLMEEWGIDVSFIHAGKHKVDGNMFNKLPEDVRARYQASVEKSYDKFVAQVSRNRAMDADKVRGTEALCYDAEDALSVGLIDAIQSPKEAVAAFRKELSSSNLLPHNGAKKMSHETKNGEGSDATQAKNDTPDTSAAAAAAAPVVATPSADTNKAKADERARISAITSCDEAKGREALANHLALNTDLSVDAAKAALAASPKTEPKKDANASFAERMNGSDNPNVGASDRGGDEEEQAGGKVSSRLVRNYERAGGITRNNVNAKSRK